MRSVRYLRLGFGSSSSSCLEVAEQPLTKNAHVEGKAIQAGGLRMKVAAVKRLSNEPLPYVRYFSFCLFLNFSPEWFQSAGGCIVVENALSRPISSPAPSITADHKT